MAMKDGKMKQRVSLLLQGISGSEYLNHIFMTDFTSRNIYRFVAHDCCKYGSPQSGVCTSLCVCISPLHIWMEGLMEGFLWWKKQYRIYTMGNAWNKAPIHGRRLIQTGDKRSQETRRHQFCCLGNYLFISSFRMRPEVLKYLKTGSSFGILK